MFGWSRRRVEPVPKTIADLSAQEARDMADKVNAGRDIAGLIEKAERAARKMIRDQSAKGCYKGIVLCDQAGAPDMALIPGLSRMVYGPVIERLEADGFAARTGGYGDDALFVEWKATNRA